MKVLVTGDRLFDSPRPIWTQLTGLYAEDSCGWATTDFDPFVVIEGAQKKLTPGTTDEYTGADYWAGRWCQESWSHGPCLTPAQWESRDWDAGVEELLYGDLVQPVVHYSYPALWNTYGRAAGPIRNSLMLKKHPDINLVLAYHDQFSESRGTRDMCEQAEKAGIEVWHLERFLPQPTLL